MPKINTGTLISLAEKSFNIPFTRTGIFWYTHHTVNTQAFNLEDVDRSSNKFYFRFTYPNYSVDVFSNDSLQYAGTITFHITQTKKIAGRKHITCEEYKTKKQPIDTLTAAKILELVTKYNILSIPTDDSVNGWHYLNGKKTGRIVVHGVVYFLEFSTTDSYTFRVFDNPHVFNEFPEARTIDTFQSQLNTTLHLEQQFNDFFATLPEGTYSTFSGYKVKYRNKRQERKADSLDY